MEAQLKLSVKVILLYAASVFAFFLVINTFGQSKCEERMLTLMENEYSEKAQLLAEGYFSGIYGTAAANWDIPKRATVDAMSGLTGARMWIVNSQRVVAYDTGDCEGTDLTKYAEYFKLKSISENIVIPGVIPEASLVVCAPIIYDYMAQGYVCLIVPMSQAKERAIPYLDSANICLLVVSIVVLAAFTVIYFITLWPVRRIRNAALECAKGNYEYSLDIHRSDEFKELSDALKYMVERIKSVDDYQKKFIANVSHDFRSPLTSIRGYAQAMKDGTIPVEAQEKYFDIILFEADRLTKLTTNLLDLNRMDDKGLMLEITTFDINTMIKQTASAFEGICTQKRIVLDLTFASWESPVEADMGRIQQVIYNLIDNAIKFSKQGSTVEVETEEKNDKLLVRVRDHGIGIARENIKKIWDRFYKIDTSRGKDKKGTGLGLSIVKEIITAHGENINVISTEGVGTEFTFTLPRAAEL